MQNLKKGTNELTYKTEIESLLQINDNIIYPYEEYSTALQKDGIFIDMKVPPQYKC